MEITVEELSRLSGDEYALIDIRDKYAFEYGHIDRAINIPQGEFSAERAESYRGKKLVICCRSGIISREIAENLRDGGYDAYNLTGGYADWLKKHLAAESRADAVERSLRKTYHTTILSRFIKAVNDYRLIQPNDRIAVCISGGKDSMLMAKLFQELRLHNKFPFELTFLVMDPGYSSENRAIIEGNAKMLGIPITVFETRIFDSVYNVKNNPCYLCARMRRGHLYNKAKELGCNKIALGHHFDDVIETILMGMIYGGQVQTMMPKLHSDNFEGMEVIRPMYLIREADIIRWRNSNDLHFIQCACRFTDTCSVSTGKSSPTGSKRLEIKQLIAKLAKGNPQIEQNIFRSVENVKLDTIISYKKDGVVHNFLEDYDKK
ncbi:MAG: ATP-binding protein [Oscillospiraceae bacterium]